MFANVCHEFLVENILQLSRGLYFFSCFYARTGDNVFMSLKQVCVKADSSADYIQSVKHELHSDLGEFIARCTPTFSFFCISEKK